MSQTKIGVKPFSQSPVDGSELHRFINRNKSFFRRSLSHEADSPDHRGFVVVNLTACGSKEGPPPTPNGPSPCQLPRSSVGQSQAPYQTP